MRLILSQTKNDTLSWRSYLLRVDFPFLAIATLLFTAGTFCVYIAAAGTVNFDSIWLRHVIALVIALSAASFLSLLPYSHFSEFSRFIYAAGVLSLILVLTAGRTIHGSRSWFVLGPLQFQPSEFAKLATILFVSSMVVHLRQRDPVLMAFSKIKILAAIGVAAALVLMQHDLSSTIGFFFIGLVYLWGLEMVSTPILLSLMTYAGLLFVGLILHILAGLSEPDAARSSRLLASWGFGPGMSAAKMGVWAAGITTAVSAAFAVLKGIYVLPRRAGWYWSLIASLLLFSTLAVSWTLSKRLKGYQKNRLISFVLPKADPLGSGYNITQSKIAIGSGGIVGRGIGMSSQSTLGFLPENHTDFAFSTLGETTGFLGAFGMLVLLGSLLWRLTHFMEMARDDFGKLVALGFWGLWMGEIAINIACVLGLFPVLGVGLPFVSYGGSRLVMNGISVGILLSISRGFYVYR